MRFGVAGGEGVEIGDEEEAVVLVLELDPVEEGAHVVAEVELAGGAHAGQDAGALGGRGGWFVRSHRLMIRDWWGAEAKSNPLPRGMTRVRAG